MRFVKVALSALALSFCTAPAYAAKFFHYQIDFAPGVTGNGGTGSLAYDLSIYRTHVHGLLDKNAITSCTVDVGICGGPYYYVSYGSNQYPNLFGFFYQKSSFAIGSVFLDFSGYEQPFSTLGTYTTADPLYSKGSMTITLIDKVVTGPVPEPATWAMMLVGFGAVGAALRRRKLGTPDNTGCVNA
ncbi:MAG: PEPxxWA-CTERM sorting domain-containing protein [Sphingobium sp.]